MSPSMVRCTPLLLSFLSQCCFRFDSPDLEVKPLHVAALEPKFLECRFVGVGSDLDSLFSCCSSFTAMSPYTARCSRT